MVKEISFKSVIHKGDTMSLKPSLTKQHLTPIYIQVNEIELSTATGFHLTLEQLKEMHTYVGKIISDLEKEN